VNHDHHVMENCRDDLELFAKFVDKNLRTEPGDHRHPTLCAPAVCEAVAILKRSGRQFEFAVDFGVDLQTSTSGFSARSTLRNRSSYNYPREIKAFYMRLNDDGRTVAAMTCWCPGSESSSAAASARSATTCSRRIHRQRHGNPRPIVVY